MKFGKGGRLSNQQKALIQGIADGKSIHRAALDAGYTENQAKGRVHAMVAKPAFQSKIAALMDAEGLDDSKLLDGLKDALEAVRPDGKPDHPVRLKALELSFRIKGSFAPERKLTGNVDIAEILKTVQQEKANER